MVLLSLIYTKAKQENHFKITDLIHFDAGRDEKFVVNLINITYYYFDKKNAGEASF